MQFSRTSTREARPRAFTMPFVLLATVLAVALVLAASPRQAMAAGVADGEDWVPTVDLAFDKDAYDEGDVAHATVSFTNDNTSTLHDVTLAVTTPDGLRVAEGSASTTVGSLAPGEVASLTVGFAKGVGASASSSLPTTGDGAGALAAALAVLAAVAVALAVAAGRAHGKSRVPFSIFLTLVLACSAVPATSIAHATEGADLEDDALPTATATSDFTLGEASYSAQATFSAAWAEEADEPTSADLEAAQAVAEGATWALVDISSSEELAQDIGPADVVLADGLEGWTVETAVRTGDKSLELSIKGDTPASGEDYGAIYLVEGAFADPKTTGAGCIPAGSPTATIAEATEHDGAGYDSHAGTFTIPLDLGDVQLGDGAAATSALPDGQSLSWTVGEADDEAICLLSVLTEDPPGDTLAEKFENMEASLTQGLVVSGTNVGTLTAIDFGQAADAQGTALADADNVLEGTVDGVTVAEVPEGEGDVTVTYHVSFATDDADDAEALAQSDGASVGLEDAEASLSLSSNEDDACGLCGKTAKVAGSGFEVTETLSRSTYNALVDGDDDAAQIGELDDAATYALAAHLAMHDIEISPTDQGSVVNLWGVPQATTEVVLSTASNEASLQSSGRSDEYDEQTRAEAADKATSEALKTTQTVCELSANIAKIVDSVIAKDSNPAKTVEAVFNTLGSIFGLSAGLVDSSNPGQYISLFDIKAELDDISDKIDGISSQVNGLYGELGKYAKQLKYEEEEPALNKAVSCLMSANAYYLKAFDKVKALDGKDIKGYADLSDEDRKAIRADLSRAAGCVELAYGSSVGVETVTHELASMIAPDTATSPSARNVVRDYFDYLDTFYNWESETTLAKKQYLVCVQNAFNVGSALSIATLQDRLYQIDQKKKQCDPSTSEYEQYDLEYTKVYTKLEQILADAKRVSEAFGTSSELYNRAFAIHATGSGSGVLNLVDNRVYSTQSWLDEASTTWYEQSFGWSYLTESQAKSMCNKDPFHVGTITLTDSISETTLTAMVARLGNVRKVLGYSDATNLKIELKRVDVKGSDTDKTGFSLASKETQVAGYFDGKRRDYLVKMGDENRYLIGRDERGLTTRDTASVVHQKKWYGRVFNLETNQVENGVLLYTATRRYHPGSAHWYTHVYFEGYRVTKNTEDRSSIGY